MDGRYHVGVNVTFLQLKKTKQDPNQHEGFLLRSCCTLLYSLGRILQFMYIFAKFFYW